MTRASAISPPAPICSSTGSSWWTCPTSCAELADVEMHCIQTSGNCVRNVTADQFAGATAGRDRRPAPAGRDHPAMVEPASGIRLPGAQIQDRGGRLASMTAPRCSMHDMAVEIVKQRRRAAVGYKVMAGGGMGRTPYHRACDERIRRARGHPRLSGSGAARLQPGQPPRQHPQAAHQDPGQRHRRRRDAPPRRARVRRDQAHRHPAIAARGTGPHRRLFRAARVRDACPTPMPTAATRFRRTG